MLIIALQWASKRHSRFFIKSGHSSCGKGCKEELHFRREKGGSWLPPIPVSISKGLYHVKLLPFTPRLLPVVLWQISMVRDFIQNWKWPRGQVQFRCSERERDNRRRLRESEKAHEVCVTIKNIHIHCWQDSELVRPLQEDVWQYLVKLKMSTPCNLAIYS